MAEMTRCEESLDANGNPRVFTCILVDTEEGQKPYGHWLTPSEMAQYQADKVAAKTLLTAKHEDLALKYFAAQKAEKATPEYQARQAVETQMMQVQLDKATAEKTTAEANLAIAEIQLAGLKRIG